ncbi:MAG: carbohydrate binding family 9 domain-containing protein, partial [Gemmatimonadetes bacterium]|nr:carbohydrate binding family 9 domain-containing protein [Gemmatimonadota bacterium]
MNRYPVIRRLALASALLACAPAVRAAAQATPVSNAAQPAVHASGPTPQMAAVRRTEPIAIDGKLDEPIWSTAPAATGFRQQDPQEGQPATQRTEVRIAYDDEALYIGARMYDSLGAAGVRTRLARRDDQPEGDYVEVIFDTYHDHTGRTIFWVNPSGVKFDAGQASPYADPSWDPVYSVAARVDSAGWTAEFRIPFSQLRFPRDSVQTWGMQVWRFVERRNEIDMWSFWGKNQSGGPSRFGHLTDLRPPRQRRSVELLPYALARQGFVRPLQPGSPFEANHQSSWRVGGDVKALLTSTLTLDATINPDFGQVEVDPAVVNLSQYETFFDEKRPFFVEGSGLFNFGEFDCHFCSNISSLTPFYSRRIGRAPQGFVSQPAVFTHSPENSTILGAAKVTGRTAGGLQVGVLDAVTRSERALAQDASGTRFTEQVEPPTNYFVGRVRKNLNGGNVQLGGIATSVARRFDSPALQNLIPGRAEAVGGDWNLYW